MQSTNTQISTQTMDSGSSSAGYAPHRPAVIKRNCSKRHVIPAAAIASSFSSVSSAEESAITVQEKDMANCLILLARGCTPRDAGGGGGKPRRRRFAEEAASTGGRAGRYVYECKTCCKRFTSFQALGGHRASHKKFKKLPTEPATSAMEKGDVSESDALLIMNSFAKTAKKHECSICGVKFSSGQALGGHMRRHRLAISPEDSSTSAEPMKEKKLLSLDLNLPASEQENKYFSFAGTPTYDILSGAGGLQLLGIVPI